MNNDKRLTLKRVWQLSEMSDKKNPKYMSFNVFNNIFKEISIEIEDMLLEGKSVALPVKMGSLRLKKFKPLKELPDWKATKTLWKASPQMREQRYIVKQSNMHTGGWRVKLHWSKFNCAWTHSGSVVCKRTRGFERKLAWLLKTDSELIEKIQD